MNRHTAQSIFEQLIALPPCERLAALEGFEIELVMRAEVEALLKSHDEAQSFLANPTASTRATVGPITESPGQRIGPYKLLQLIGEGGFGTVFLAEQTETVRRRVAFKIIKLGMDTKQVVARFEAERQALAIMDHPHIARVLDGGATASGRPYFVMEYVVGDTITAFADAHKLPLKARLELFSQVCAAVQHAHIKGVIHRDIKPANVLVSMVDGKPYAKVIDFGIAKAMSQPLTEKTLFTEHRQLIGTPEYMSPEQAEGSLDVDTRADVYALGVLLYELLTGTTPFDAKRLRSAAWGEMQRIIKEEEPPTPSARVTQRLFKARNAGDHVSTPPRPGGADAVPTPQDLRGELDWIVMKAVEKERARRYESAGQLATDVARHIAGEAVTAAPPDQLYRLRKFLKRHRRLVAGASVVVVSIASGIAATTWSWRIARDTDIRLQREIGERELADANLVMNRHFATSDDVRGYTQPTTDELRLAYFTRTRHLGESDEGTLDARMAWGWGTADSKERFEIFREVMRESERSPFVSEVRLLTTYQAIASDRERHLDFASAEQVNLKIVQLLQRVIDGGRASSLAAQIKSISWFPYELGNVPCLCDEHTGFPERPRSEGASDEDACRYAMERYRERTARRLQSWWVHNLAAGHLLRGFDEKQQLILASSEVDLACKAEPDCGAIRSVLALVRYREGNYLEAVAECEKAARSPDGVKHPIRLATIAMARHRLGEAEASRICLNSLLQLKSDHKFASLLREDGRARAIVDEAVDLFNGNR